MLPLPNSDQLDMKQWITTHAAAAWAKIWCLKNDVKLGCGWPHPNLPVFFLSNGGNHLIFCKDFINIVSYVLSKNEYLAIFRFEINPNFSYFQILYYWLGWIGTALLAMQNKLLGSGCHHCIRPKCPMNKNDKMNYHNYDHYKQNGIYPLTYHQI